ncbi:Hypothetical predicted protein [Cloeon dipterum]|uniref:Uncharacterized protein n=1 Tax=Cloeon dipterum TaxID=197152 RepID=A0A8S1D665_9INSE|nr:Hypothetical predicted protein [Cloeon dipterum]
MAMMAPEAPKDLPGNLVNTLCRKDWWLKVESSMGQQTAFCAGSAQKSRYMKGCSLGSLHAQKTATLQAFMCCLRDPAFLNLGCNRDLLIILARTSSYCQMLAPT